MDHREFEEFRNELGVRRSLEVTAARAFEACYAPLLARLQARAFQYWIVSPRQALPNGPTGSDGLWLCFQGPHPAYSMLLRLQGDGRLLPFRGTVAYSMDALDELIRRQFECWENLHKARRPAPVPVTTLALAPPAAPSSTWVGEGASAAPPPAFRAWSWGYLAAGLLALVGVGGGWAATAQLLATGPTPLLAAQQLVGSATATLAGIWLAWRGADLLLD